MKDACVWGFAFFSTNPLYTRVRSKPPPPFPSDFGPKSRGGGFYSGRIPTAGLITPKSAQNAVKPMLFHDFGSIWCHFWPPAVPAAGAPRPESKGGGVYSALGGNPPPPLEMIKLGAPRARAGGRRGNEGRSRPRKKV